MREFTYYFFDLDGTLTDPGIGITNSVMYALKQFGITEHDRRELYPFIGPPLHESFQKYYHFSMDQAKQAIDHYRTYFREKGIYENLVYDGVLQMLQECQRKGKKIILATSKPEEFAVEILKHFDLYQYFDLVAGATMDISRSQKGDVITYAISRLKLEREKEKIVMIGDREQDILGAKQNGLYSVGVLYGYGSQEELSSAGADLIVKAPRDLVEALEKKQFLNES